MSTTAADAKRNGAPSALAVFDLDGTLVTGDTFVPFLVSYTLRHRGRRTPAALLMLPVELTLYALRLRSAARAKEKLLRRFLGDESESTIAEHAAWFVENWVRRKLRPEVVDVLRTHREAGHRILLLSASPDLYVRTIARELGITEVVCTRVAVSGGRCEGRLVGPNCKGEAKIALLQQATGVERPPAGSYAYGDSRSDLPLLRWVEHGYLVTATRPWRQRPVRLLRVVEASEAVPATVRLTPGVELRPAAWFPREVEVDSPGP